MFKSQWILGVGRGEHLAGRFLRQGWVDAKLGGGTWEETVFLPSSSSLEGQVPRAADGGGDGGAVRLEWRLRRKSVRQEGRIPQAKGGWSS